MWHGRHRVPGSIDLVMTLETLCFPKYSASLSKNMQVIENYLFIFITCENNMVLTKIEYLSYYISLKNLGDILDFSTIIFYKE